MSGADNKDQETSGDSDDPKGPLESSDLSVSSSFGISSPMALPMDSYATQYVDRPLPAEESGKTKGRSGLPTDLPGFIVESELGRGAFGVVFCARDEMLDRKVAIKMPLISNPAHRKRYIDEARKAVKLDHPSIVPIYQVGMTTNGEPFVVQKLIVGSTLRLMIQSGDNRLPISQIIALMRQVCSAVDAAHTAGVVHRDLKPENLLVEPEGRVYVADFGLAILEDDETNRKGREVAGTPLYMSPEQFAGRVEWLDGRSDIWALGVILYELLSGKTPFSGATISELKDQIRNKDPRPIHQRNPKIPSAFDAVFRKCCAKAVGDRYASVRELIGDLDVVAESLPFLDTVNSASPFQSGSLKALSSNGSALGSATGSAIASGVESGRRSVGAGSGNTSAIGQSTVRNSFGGSTVSQSGNFGKFVAMLVATVLLLSGLTGVAWFAKLGPFALVERTVPNTDKTGENLGEHKIDGSKGDGSKLPTTDPGSESGASVPPDLMNSSPGVNADLSSKKDPGPLVAPQPKLPKKPFEVSVDDTGTHKSIAKAIAESEPGDTITIREGEYRETLVIDRSVNLVGLGRVLVISTSGSCVELKGDIEVSIEKMNFDSQAVNFNTIDIYGGRLNLKVCDVFASSPESYDCVKVRANGTLVAEKCKFESTVHPAIVGDNLAAIEIRDSEFSFAGDVGSGTKRIGIQATGTSGRIRDCVFIGPCIGGIDWRECPDQELLIEGCQFDNCDIGIQVRRCSAVKIKESFNGPCEIKNAVAAVSIKNSQVELSKVIADGFSDRNRVGMQITEKSKVNCVASTFSGNACGVLVNGSSLVVDRVETRETGLFGIAIDGGSLEGKELNLQAISHYGMVVLSKDAFVKLESLKVSAAPAAGPRISLGVYISSGSVDFREGEVSNCLCGIFVDPSRTLINDTGYPERRSLMDLIGDPQTIPLTISPVAVLSDRLTLNKCDYAWVFNGIGTSRIKELGGDLRAEGRMPKLISRELEMNGDDLTNFSVVKKVAESK